MYNNINCQEKERSRSSEEFNPRRITNAHHSTYCMYTLHIHILYIHWYYINNMYVHTVHTYSVFLINNEHTRLQCKRKQWTNQLEWLRHRPTDSCCANWGYEIADEICVNRLTDQRNETHTRQRHPFLITLTMHQHRLRRKVRPAIIPPHIVHTTGWWVVYTVYKLKSPKNE